jgi:hypothetical protein
LEDLKEKGESIPDDSNTLEYSLNFTSKWIFPQNTL